MSGDQRIAAFFPVLDAAVVDNNLCVAEIFDSDRCLVGKNSAVAHAVGDDQLILVAAEEAALLVNLGPRDVD